MKLSEPFAGYQLATGHFIYHLAFFSSSFLVSYHDETPQLEQAFLFIRYAHLTVMVLGLINDIIVFKFQDDELDKVAENRGFRTGMILFTKFLETMQVVVFQASIFYAQWCIGVGVSAGTITDETLRDDSNEAWLAIEITAFYLIIAGAVLYIAATMLSHQFWPDQPKEDDYEKYDIIKYFTTSINWYSFNTIIIGVPVILLILSQTKPRLEKDDADGTFWYCMLILAIAHTIQFIFIRQLMTVQTRESAFKSVNNSAEDDDNF